MKIAVEVTSCRDCPHLYKERVYTADSFEYVEKFTCKANNRVISGYVEWHDKLEIPKWCPAKIKNSKTQNKSKQ